ncbi:hypothetical protein H696_02432 [Fonticula alba]|uniref:Biogenesis of lysosome-related organelles complex 1 subunit 2 n=1 Tax=Fonticula alba TaxID=691883 RepID=A0A058ZDG7_FONAL|nr:hypothetical protein H696_02432 [Fonticula alba]KCV71487.1 hypothetical protein H696_02432 [Fonticula alba]|eukprot:XP_009494610.1 hypothetical protein H696_02432 [Fonticula alba]
MSSAESPPGTPSAIPASAPALTTDALSATLGPAPIVASSQTTAEPVFADASLVSDADRFESEQARLIERADDMFRKISQYINAEMSTLEGDYSNLGRMNLTAAHAYAEIERMVLGLNSMMSELQNKYEHNKVYFAQIDALEKSVERLETAARELDAYARRLDQAFRAFGRG